MNLLIYLIVFLEGFTTLAVEIIALRIFTPIIGSNSISTSIILGVILLALSYWYYIWGKLSLKKELIYKRLYWNFLIASFYYFFAFVLGSLFLQLFLAKLNNYFLSILITSILLFFIPVFLASQTIPLFSEILKWKNSWEKMWKLLFFSTVGSFIWAIGTASILFPIFWVLKTAIFISILLIFSALLIALFYIKKEKNIILSLVLLLIFWYLFFIVSQIKANTVFHKANAYHNIDIYDINDQKRVFSLDNSYSSGIDLKTKKSFFNYVLQAEKIIKELKPKNILVIWAAWFSFPNDISKYSFIENIDVVDVDPELKNISEKYFLEQKLSSKIHFYPEPARYFLNNISKKYDFIMVDAFSGKTPPSQLLTYEFFKKLLQKWDFIYINSILDSKYETDFTKNFLYTINKAFWDSYFKNVNNYYEWLTNIVIVNKEISSFSKNEAKWILYTDDKNSIELDLFKQNFKLYKY